VVYYEPDWDEVDCAGPEFVGGDGEEGAGEGADWDEEKELRGIWEQKYCGEEGYEPDDGYWGYGGAYAEGAGPEWAGGPEEPPEFFEDESGQEDVFTDAEDCLHADAGRADPHAASDAEGGSVSKGVPESEEVAGLQDSGHGLEEQQQPKPQRSSQAQAAAAAAVVPLAS
jgi:hypothetical protein